MCDLVLILVGPVLFLSGTGECTIFYLLRTAGSVCIVVQVRGSVYYFVRRFRVIGNDFFPPTYVSI